MSQLLRGRIVPILLLSLFLHGTALSQTQPADSSRLTRTINDAYGKLEQRDQRIAVAGNDTAIRILENIQNKTIKLEELKTVLENRLDTADMRLTLPQYASMTDLLMTNARENAGKLNLRYLMGLEVLLNTMLDNTNAYSEQVKKKAEELKQVERTLGNIGPDSLLALGRATNGLDIVKKEMVKLDSSTMRIRMRYDEDKIMLAQYQTAISQLQIKLLELKNLILAEKKNVQSSFWSKEINYAWEAPSYPRGRWPDQLAMSNGLNGKILGNYFGKSKDTSLVFALAIALLAFLAWRFLRVNAPLYRNGEVIRTRVPYFSAHPLFSALVLTMPFSYLVYTDMPVSFVAVLTLVFVLSSLPLALHRYGRMMDIVFIAGMPVYLFLSYVRLNWETVYEFRWMVLLASLASLAMGIFIWRQAEKEGMDDKREPILKWLSGFLILMSAVAIGGNLLGRYNVAKVYSTTGIVGFYRGIGLYFFVQVATEALYLLLEAGKRKSDGAASVAEHLEFRSKVRRILVPFSLIAWTYFTLWYLSWLDPIVLKTTALLQTERQVGDLKFTYGSIALFIGILVLATFLANLVSWITSLREQRPAVSRKNRLGSSVLLIRLAILTAGFLLAVAATKIPIDRITIVLGALSVGIGFGLQNLIDNLASGIILALERPIQVGDQVEVDGKSGTVKEIGIRSSRIRASDGADVVFPNSHLIANGLVNWTLKDNFKKVDLVVPISNGSDPVKAKELLEEVLQARDLLPHPAPQVAFHDLAHNAVLLKVSFWVDDPGKSGPLRSAIIGDMVSRFREAGIRMPEKE